MATAEAFLELAEAHPLTGIDDLETYDSAVVVAFRKSFKVTRGLEALLDDRPERGDER